MPRVVQIPHISKVDIPEARQAIPYVHAYLRQCILDGTMLPGTKLSQVTLARQLGLDRRFRCRSSMRLQALRASVADRIE